VKILEALDNGSCRFEELSEKDVAELDEQHQAKIASGELPDAKPPKIRSDTGKPKKRKEVRESDLSDSSDSSDDNERVPKKKRRLRSPSVLNVKSKAMITDTEDE
jgi:hypothetical protein